MPEIDIGYSGVVIDIMKVVIDECMREKMGEVEKTCVGSEEW